MNFPTHRSFAFRRRMVFENPGLNPHPHQHAARLVPVG